MLCYKCRAAEAPPLCMCSACHAEAVAALQVEHPVGRGSSSQEYELRTDIGTRRLSTEDTKKLNRTSRNGLRIKKGAHLS